ncbi:CsbD family protein [Chitinimonas naiadis]
MNKAKEPVYIKGSEQIAYPPQMQQQGLVNLPTDPEDLADAVFEQQASSEQAQEDGTFFEDEDADPVGAPNELGMHTDNDGSDSERPRQAFNTARFDPSTMGTVKSDGGIKPDWEDRIDAARSIWTELSEDELLKTEGHEQRLSSLVRQCYGISSEAANQQVRAFLTTQRY